MPNQKNHPQRQSIRLQEFDYAQSGAYFVTVVCHKRMNLFGEISDGELNLNRAGEIVEQTWLEIPKHFPNVNSDIFVIMPNHVHGIIEIVNDIPVRARHASPQRFNNEKPQSKRHNGVKPQSVGAIIGSFKSAVTKKLHGTKIINKEKIWQRNYYEHVIRDEDDYQQIADYIETNPLNWEYDRDNPDHIKP